MIIDIIDKKEASKAVVKFAQGSPYGTVAHGIFNLTHESPYVDMCCRDVATDYVISAWHWTDVLKIINKKVPPRYY